MGGSVLLRDTARRGTAVLGRVLRPAESAGRARAQPMPRLERYGTVGVRRLRLFGSARGTTHHEGPAVSSANVPQRTQSLTAATLYSRRASVFGPGTSHTRSIGARTRTRSRSGTAARAGA